MCTPIFTAALFIIIQDMETSMSTDRRMDEEDIIHKCNGILLSAIKRMRNSAIYSNIDGPRNYHTKSEKDKYYMTWLMYIIQKKL